jgi:hypothetical protein
MGLGREAVRAMRRGTRKLKDFHFYLGFTVYDFPDSDMKTSEYRTTFDEVYRAYRSGLYVAALSDAADLLLKRTPKPRETERKLNAQEKEQARKKGFQRRRFSRFLDLTLLYAFNIKDWDVCLSSELNDYNWDRFVERGAQSMAVGKLKNPGAAPEHMEGPVKDLESIMPRLSRSFRKYMPWKTGFVLGMIFERADERYDNRKNGITSPVSTEETAGTKGIGSFIKGHYKFINEARESGDRSETAGKKYTGLKIAYKAAEKFVRRHPYIAGTAAAYATMYVEGWYGNRVVEHFLRKEQSNLAAATVPAS